MSQRYRKPRRKASRTFAQQFDLQGATAFGGLNQLARFLLKIDLEKRLARRFRDAKSPWSSWRLDRVLRILLDAHFAGIDRLYHFEDPETEPLFCARHGVERLPDLNTLYRDLRRFENSELLASLIDLLREVVVEALRKQDRTVLDVDSTTTSRSITSPPRASEPTRPTSRSRCWRGICSCFTEIAV